MVDKITESSDSDNTIKEERSEDAKIKSENEKEEEDKWEDVLGSGHLMRKVT